MTTTKTKYGEYVHGDTVEYDDGTAIRYDRYTGNNGVKELVRVIVAGCEDNSGIYDHSTLPGGGYNSKCSCCYLGIPHSENYHRKRLEKAV